MQFTRDIIITREHTFKLTFDSRSIEAHSLLSGLDEPVRTQVEEVLTDASAKLRTIIDKEVPKWNSEHRS